jgi:hypothetical protein
MAEMLMNGDVSNTLTTMKFSEGSFGEQSLQDCAKAMLTQIGKVKDNDLSCAETILTSQAVALNAIFGELSRRAAMNMDKNLQNTERYLRLALKAQSQSRATLETLVAIKNPPVVIAQQANIAHGPQQVNNASPAPTAPAPAPAPASKTETVQNELLETRDGQRLDTRTTRPASRVDPQLAPVGAIDRATDG